MAALTIASWGLAAAVIAIIAICFLIFKHHISC